MLHACISNRRGTSYCHAWWRTMRCGACSSVDLAMETGTRPAGAGDQTALNLGARGLHTGRSSRRLARVRPAAGNVPAGQPAPRAWSVCRLLWSCQYACLRWQRAACCTAGRGRSHPMPPPLARACNNAARLRGMCRAAGKGRTRSPSN